MRKEAMAIERALGGRLVGTRAMKNYVAEAVALLPGEIQEFVTKTCWFLSSMDDAWASTFTGNDVNNQHLIFLSDDLLGQHPQQIRYTILHEIGHVVLGHRNAILANQSKREIRKQEKEADAFAKEVLS